jgi:hypothetical protein
MIPLEYIIAVCQEDTTSVAINSHRRRNNNPALQITAEARNFRWSLDGLQIGSVEEVPGDPLANRLDFYISMEEIVYYRNLFPPTRARSLGVVDGLRIPTGTERAGGKTIRWRGPVGRVEILDTKIVVPPFIYRHADSPIIINIDRESSPYPIDHGHGRTMRELHFGLEHPFILRENLRVSIARAEIIMNSNQYSTVLEAIDTAILIHQRT